MTTKAEDKKRKGAVPGGGDPFPVFAPGEEPLEDDRHERFCEELLLLKPPYRAYMLAFPDSSYNSAKANACRLQKNPVVAERLAFLKAEQRERYRMEAEDVHARLVMAANLDPADLLDSEGKPLPLHKLPPDVRLCIESIEEKRYGKKIEFVSKRAALEMIGRHLKMFTDKVEHSGKVTLEELVGGGE